ncbi:hypothetical protein ACFO3I_04055 [Rheinheimera marina]|uniref:Uncharacterized protein n=1 Tax=Rheinheimera marina TaxID=1774958 RepID=A0ABV9JIN7_9GAMM
MEKKPLYRKVNTRTHGVRHKVGGDFRHDRRSDNYDVIGMASKVQRGLDYTPLYKFLLSKVGQSWAPVYREAVARLDKEEPIFWLVSRTLDDGEDLVRVGESSYFNGLYIDDKGVLQVVAPEVTADSLEPSCNCCTHTLNGVVFSKKFAG